MRERQTKTEAYIEELFAIEDEILKKVRGTAPPALAHIQISAVEGQLLYFLAKLHKAEYILEIGTFVGYSTIWLARALLAGGVLYTIEKSSEYHQIACGNIASGGLAPKVHLLCGDAKQAIESLDKDLLFDLVFIDAAKKDYPDYLNKSLSKLREGGLVIADNTLLFGTISGEEPSDKKGKEMWHAINTFNEMLSNKELFTSILIPTISGLTVAIKNSKA